MRILLTCHRFWPHPGGTEEVVARLAAAFARAGHDATVATSREPGTPEQEAREGYAIRRFPLRRLGKFRFPPAAYAAFVRDGAWDVVHLHGQRVWSTDHLYRHLDRTPAPVVFTAHGFYQHHMEALPFPDLFYYKVLLPAVLRRAAAATVLTEAERRELLGWGVPSERIHLIPDGLDLAEFGALPAGFRARHGYGPDEPVLLYVGGFYRNKRVERLVEVAAKVGAPLVVIGKDADGSRARCERLARRAGARVLFLGVVPREELLAAYREATLLVLASAFEGFGVVLLEAMAAGLPFVATPVGAAPDLARQGAGVCADEGALAAEVGALLRDPSRRAEMSDAGRRAVKGYAWPDVAARYLALYREVAAA